MEALIGAPALSSLRSLAHRSGRKHGYGVGTLRPRQTESSLFALTPEDHSLLTPHLKEQALKVGTLLQEAGERVEQIYFPHEGMVSLLAIMSDGQGIETATVGSEGVVGAMSGFGASRGFTRAVVQAPLVASRISSLQFQAALQKSESKL